MIDYHIHPNFSYDATGSMVDYCRSALKRGIREICFTTHYEPDPVRASIERVIVKGVAQPMDSDWVKIYSQEIEDVRAQFPQLQIRMGVEIGYEMGLEGKIADFISDNQFDFVLGAIHCLDHVAITSRDELKEFRTHLKPKGAEFIARRYFDYVRAAAGSRLFDCIAHLDIWRKYIVPEMGDEFNNVIGEFIPLIIEAVVQSGVGLELNISSFRRGENEPYPANIIIAQAVAAGVDTFTVGSDAHSPDDVGVVVSRVIAILGEFGLKPARFTGRRKILT